MAISIRLLAPPCTRSTEALPNLLFLLMCLMLLSGCNPGFVARAAWEEFKILRSREPLEISIADQSIKDERRHKLQLIQDVQRFIPHLGMASGGRYTTYAEIDRDTLLWVLMASRKDAFELYQWWFPFVGSVPYKGFFEHEDGKKAAQDLEQQGFETSLRTTDAFSTLGWFNDPVLSTMLQRDEVELADLILHETFHANVWIPGNVAFNETAAHFVGMQGAVDYFTTRQMIEHSQTASRRLRWHLQFAARLSNLIASLSELYATDRPFEEKITERQRIYGEAVDEILQAHPGATLPRELNNAFLMQWRVYMTHLDRFQALFERCGGHWSNFIAELKLIATLASRSRKADPFELLSERVLSCAAEERPALLRRYIFSPPS